MTAPPHPPDLLPAEAPPGGWTVEALPAHVGHDATRRYELINGVLLVTTQPHSEHQRIAVKLARFLDVWSEEHDSGDVFFAPGIIFAPTEVAAPDVVWVRRERLAALLHADGKVHGAPDLVVEVLSPGAANAECDRVAKRAQYGQVAEYWIVDRFQAQVEVYRPTPPHPHMLQLAATIGRTGVLTSPLLPGFACPLTRIFRGE